MSDSIKVAIKVRPIIRREEDENLPIQWLVQGNSIVPTDAELKKRGDGGFQFDHIFDTNASNNDVFNNIVKPIVDAAVKGFNGTVFAYRQTSSGRTYTMMGTPEEPGIIPLAVEHMFDAIANTFGREFLLRLIFLFFLLHSYLKWDIEICGYVHYRSLHFTLTNGSVTLHLYLIIRSVYLYNALVC
ncbi:uncharacterized protein [Anoplolepis gracilipes]|uniref:uncharacterized protein n=1 Tax=Anoplolepis gracilipes TaxID=354296 RepID=UPI003BA11F3F